LVCHSRKQSASALALLFVIPEGNLLFLPLMIRIVEQLGHHDKLIWTQDEQGLTVVMPDKKPCNHAITLKIV
jgi:hypothetical protein